MSTYIHSKNGEQHIKPIYIIRETMRLLKAEDDDVDAHNKGVEVLIQLMKDLPEREYDLCLDDFSDKYIAPILSESNN